MRGESACYALQLAPRVPGKDPRFAPQGRHRAPDEVEIGPLIEDAEAPDARISELLRS